MTFRTVLIICVLSLLIASCGSQSSVSNDTATVDRQQNVYAQNQPVPFFEYSQDRDVLIQIYMAKNEARNTYTVVTADGSGQVLFVCPSVGFALPADTQLTNGLQVVYDRYGAVVKQAEPNGLYSSKNTDGTYVLCVRESGEVVPVYTEAKVTTYPFAVKVENGQIVDVGGASSINLDMTRHPVVAPTPTP